MTARKPTRRKGLGVSLSEYDRMLLEQGGHCAICPQKPGTRRLSVDHNHKTMKIRGLLCHRCNRGLGYFSDDAVRLRRAAYYLDKAARD